MASRHDRMTTLPGIGKRSRPWPGTSVPNAARLRHGARWGRHLLAAFLGLGSGVAHAGASTLPLVMRATIVLPGSPSRFDYQSQDAALGRLFISHMGDGTVLVFDIKTNRVIANLPGFPEDTGITAVPSLNRVYVSVTGGWLHQAVGHGEIAVLNATTLKVVARIPAGRFPDGSAYVPGLHRLYVSDESGGTETVIDTVTNRRVATLSLGGSAGMTAFDPISGNIFVNVQSRNVLAEIDPVANAIIARIPLPRTCLHNHGLLIYPKKRLAFIACDHNARLLTLDLQTGKVVSIHTVGRNPDVLALDSVRNRLYVASESGVVAVFSIGRHDIRKLGEGVIGDNAHTVSVDTATGLAYFPIRNLRGHPVLKIMAFHSRRLPP